MTDTPLTFDVDVPREIVIVGAGGTGSQVARTVARMIYDMQSRNLETPDLRIADPDVVEYKNVGRQMFAPAHVGMYKAQVLAQTFNRALGLDIEWCPEPFNREKHLQHQYGRPSLMIGCVDSHVGRKEMFEANSYWIDCGNDFDHGQVIIGNRMNTEYVMERTRQVIESGKTDLRDLPTAPCYFPDLLEPEPPAPEPDLSCAELMVRGDQHLLINEAVAAAAAQYVYRILYRLPIRTFTTFVDVEMISTRSVPITVENLEYYTGLKVDHHVR